MTKYNPTKIEKKWQKHWQDKKFYQTKDEVKGKKNMMILAEFPYPSGNLHVGHWYTYALTDVLARYWRLNGKNVMFPIGFDAFGLPAENAAIKNKIHPAIWTKKNIAHMTKQLESIGATFDWDRKIETIDPEYYKWNQWIFIKMYERGLVYRAKRSANWCPKCKTILANEQVVGEGICDRCQTPVAQKEIEQWLMKITDFADDLIDDMKDLDWPQTTKLAQKNWIGRSEGSLISFSLENKSEKIEVFTTRADTLFGATYLVIAPEHPIALSITSSARKKEVERYIEETGRKTELDRLKNEKTKTGVFTGAYAINPASREKIPVWVADYVLGHYGTGAIMAVPAHDSRDHEFAKKFGLKIINVINPENEEKRIGIYEGEGILINSSTFNGLKTQTAREKITLFTAGKTTTDFRLRDWIISRQRYWGAPIPMVKCEKCGYQPVNEKDLPIKLPSVKNFLPTDDGRSPLAKADDKWLKTKCPKCHGEAIRETDTMDTFVDSSWYFLRYTDPKNKNAFADAKKMKKWLPVPLYIGGPEHNTMHLLYARFFTKALHRLGFLDFNEPFISRRNHGMILGSDGQKMSKSRGNVLDPDSEVKKYGADTMRIYFSFIGPFDQDGSWNPDGLNGITRFLNRIWTLIERQCQQKLKQSPVANSEIEKIIHKTIKKATNDIQTLNFNTATSALMECLNTLQKYSDEGIKIQKKMLEDFIRILSPLAPHISEELWQILGHKKSLHFEKWPQYNERALIEKYFELVVQINGKVRAKIKAPTGILEKEAEKLAISQPKIKEALEDKKIKKTIFIKDRLISFVV